METIDEYLESQYNVNILGYRDFNKITLFNKLFWRMADSISRRYDNDFDKALNDKPELKQFVNESYTALQNKDNTYVVQISYDAPLSGRWYSGIVDLDTGKLLTLQLVGMS